MTKEISDVTKDLELLVDYNARTLMFKKTYISPDGEELEGVFKAVYPSIMDRIKVGTIRAETLNGAPSASVDNFTDDLVYMIAYLSVILKEKPDWFNFDSFDDIDFMRDVFIEVSNWVNNFRHKAQQRFQPNAGDSTGEPDKKTVGSRKAIKSSV